MNSSPFYKSKAEIQMQELKRLVLPELFSSHDCTSGFVPWFFRGILFINQLGHLYYSPSLYGDKWCRVKSDHAGGKRLWKFLSPGDSFIQHNPALWLRCKVGQIFLHLPKAAIFEELLPWPAEVVTPPSSSSPPTTAAVTRTRANTVGWGWDSLHTTTAIFC